MSIRFASKLYVKRRAANQIREALVVHAICGPARDDKPKKRPNALALTQLALFTHFALSHSWHGAHSLAVWAQLAYGRGQRRRGLAHLESKTGEQGRDRNFMWLKAVSGIGTH